MVTRNKAGITLIELLVVIAILGVIAAITFPILSSGRKASYRTVALSNLRQCAAGVLIYVEQNGAPPIREVAIATLGEDITCDPNDYFRQNCRGDWAPLVGSFAYLYQSASELTLWRSFEDNHSPHVMFYSIFGEVPHLNAFKGETPGASALLPGTNFATPAHVVVARSDGSAGRVRLPSPPAGTLVLSWPLTFFTLNKYSERQIP